MGQKELLFAFEEKYRFLYDIEVNGVPIYTCLRDGVCARLQGNTMESSAVTNKKGKIFIRRVFDSGRKIYHFRKKKTLIFTSSVYRRDKGRNLAAEYLIQKYPEAVVFEWPSRNETYDSSYFTDDNKDKYCPLELYLVIYKLYIRIFRKQYTRLYEECKDALVFAFANSHMQVDEHEHTAIEYLMQAMPESYAITAMSQSIFKKLFEKYQHVEYAIDFWGSARENIIPVLPGKPESIELQHGIITSSHPGYIYPGFLKEVGRRFFGRNILVFGEQTKKMLIKESIFKECQIEIVGNPRIAMYKQKFPVEVRKKKWILFASGPVGGTYYESMISYLSAIQQHICTDKKWNEYQLAIKLHPRENNINLQLYYKAIPGAVFFDNGSQLYEILQETYVLLTLGSTTLYEAALFDVPTVTLDYYFDNLGDVFGFDTWTISSDADVKMIFDRLADKQQYEAYLGYLKTNTLLYM